jgi:hypothetical protein
VVLTLYCARSPFVSSEVERTPWVMPGGAAQRAPGVA